RFQTVWRELYSDSAFDILDRFPAPLFNVGLVRWPANPPHPFNIIDTNWLRARVALDHAVGDFGLHGKGDLRPLSDEDVFTIGLLDRARQNSATIISGSGAIESLYPLRAFEQKKWTAGRNYLPGQAALRVVTLLRPGAESRTLCEVVPYTP